MVDYYLARQNRGIFVDGNTGTESLKGSQWSESLLLQHLVDGWNMIQEWSLDIVPESDPLRPDAVVSFHGELGDREMRADMEHKSETICSYQNIFQRFRRCFHPCFVGLYCDN